MNMSTRSYGPILVRKGNFPEGQSFLFPKILKIHFSREPKGSLFLPAVIAIHPILKNLLITAIINPDFYLTEGVKHVPE